LKKVLLIALLLTGCLNFAIADVITDSVPVSARTLGMGSTGVSLVEGSYSAFMNPANLATKRNKPKIELLNLQLDFNEGGINTIGSTKNPTSLGSTYDWLKSNTGEWAGSRFSIYPNFSSRFVSFGILYESNFAAKYDLADPNIANSTSTLTQKGFKRLMPTGSLSFRMMGGVLKFGYTLAVDYLGVANAVVAQPETKDLSFTNGILEGVGIRHTVGTTLTLPVAHVPSFSAVVRDVGNTKYFGGSLNRTQKMSLDVGMGHLTYVGKAIDFRWGVDFRDVMNQTKTNRMRRIFSGAELKLFQAMSLRAGFGQGSLSAGFGVKLKRINVDFSWYSAEMGNRLRDDVDSRYVLQFTWSLFNSN